MAQEEEEIVIIEDSDAATDADHKGKANVEEEIEADKQQKKRLLIFGALALFLVLLIIFVALLVIEKIKKKHNPKSLSTATIEQRLQERGKKKIEPSKLEHLIAKANYLYTNGQKEQALKLYEYIAQFSEAVSLYNLGVAKLKSKQYKEALKNFNSAIENGEKRCVSAINAAVCALYLHDRKSFQYYINLAEAYLPKEAKSPLYPYYYTLVKFYKQHYYEALAAVDKIEHPEYIEQKNELKAKLNALFNSDYNALEALESLHAEQNTLQKGQLYARVGDLNLALNHFQNATLRALHPQRAALGLIYTQLKLGNIKDAAHNLQSANDTFGDKLLEPYPVKVFLRRSLFDPLAAQKLYREEIVKDPFIRFSEIFYFSPYKIFNANQTINYIRKGNATAYIDSIESAETFLKKGLKTSKVNKGIAQAIKLALGFHIRKANLLLQKLVDIQPKHAILHYNLALTYAQLGDMHNAYKHFIWSYHLDAKNYLPGIYAYMASILIHNEDKKLLNILKETLANEDDTEQTDFYRHLLHVAQGHFLATVDWLDNNYKTRPVYLILSHIIAMQLSKKEQAIQSAKDLISLTPQEIVPHALYVHAAFKDEPAPEYAKKTAQYLKKQKFNYKDLFYGPEITRYHFTMLHLLTGRTSKLVTLLRKHLNLTGSSEIVQSEQALALALLYNKNFEESYTLYNQLIDKQHIRDAKTLFLASIAAIAANHHANAIALLELSKLKDRKFRESRYALGLLYFEVNNARGAEIEFAHIQSNDFHSKYFNFDIDLEKLTFYKLHPDAKP